MPITINLTGVSTDEFAAVPEGRYKVSVFTAEMRTGKDSGKPYLNWEFRIQEPTEFAGRRLWHITSLQENALFNLKGLLLALGVPEEKLKGDFDLEPSDYYGQELVLQIKHQEYQGQPRARVSKMYPADTEIGLDRELEFTSANVPSSGDNI